MSISFTCSACPKTYTVPDGNAGKRTKCPACGTMLLVPSLQPANAKEIDFDKIEDGPEPEYVPVSRSRPSVDDTPVVGRTRFNVPAAPSGTDPKLKKLRGPRYREIPAPRPRRGLAVSPGILAGAGMLLGGTVLLFVGLAGNRLIFYAPILMVLGLARIVMGLMGRDVD